MRAGAGTDTRRDGLDFDRAAPDGGGGLSVVVGAEPSTERSSAELPDRHVEFIDGKRVDAQFDLHRGSRRNPAPVPAAQWLRNL